MARSLFAPVNPARCARMLALLVCSTIFAGCGKQPSATAGKSLAPPSRSVPAETRQPSAPTPKPAPPDIQPPAAAPESPAAPAKPKTALKPEPPRRSLADLLDQPDDGTFAPPFMPGQPAGQPRSSTIPIDDAKVAAAGIRKLSGQHLTLYTDVPSQPVVDELPDVFDAAVPEWCRYFGMDPLEVADWHVTGFLVQEKTRFQGTGLMPADLPPFLNGYQRGPYIWAYEQSDAYYRRHLLLHEGVHGFMNLLVGGIGPPWYAEGMAELLSTHLWQDGRIKIAYMPEDKSETPGWGRIKIVRDDLQAGRGMMPISIMNYGPQAHLQNEPYGWCWALAAFLDGHPAYRDRFRSLFHRVREPNLTEACQQLYADDWIDLNEQWQIFVVDLDYGYNLERAAVLRKPPAALPPGGTTVTVDATRGWQSTGIWLEANQAYRLIATGRYQVAQTTEIWWCEPGGVTIHYHRGQPLGLLVGAVRDDSQPLAGLSPLTRPEPVGLSRTWIPETSGTLYLKINESSAQLADNQGELTVRIEPAAPSG
ncbi:MAG: hypothetical protein KJ000_09020 [Pirellulaceae bacterium]|nr:hypothetical protein [Pirellulaceae bacterium]